MSAFTVQLKVESKSDAETEFDKRVGKSCRKHLGI